MALRRLSGVCEAADLTCDGVWFDDRYPEEVVVVGKLVDRAGTPPLAGGEGAIRISRQVLVDAQLNQ